MATEEQVEVMKSPFTGGDAKLCHEPSVLTFRKEQFSYMHQFYECQKWKGADVDHESRLLLCFCA